MYLKCELPDGYFRLFDDISDLVIPKERIMVVFPPPSKKKSEDDKTVHGICVWDAIDCMSKGGQNAVRHIIGDREIRECGKPPIDFITNNRTEEKHKEVEKDDPENPSPTMAQRYPYHQMCIFNDKHGNPVVFCTQYPVYVCNDKGKTIEKF